MTTFRGLYLNKEFAVS